MLNANVPTNASLCAAHKGCFAFEIGDIVDYRYRNPELLGVEILERFRISDGREFYTVWDFEEERVRQFSGNALRMVA